MNQFLFLFRHSPRLKDFSPLQLGNYLQSWVDWISILKSNGSLIRVEIFEQKGKEITGKEKFISDTLHTANENSITGFLLLKCLNMDTAVEIAKECPIYETDSGLEIKQIALMD